MLITQMMRVLPTPVPSAYPSSRSTFGLGVIRKSESGPLIGSDVRHEDFALVDLVEQGRS